jgi:hypothetical protein
MVGKLVECTWFQDDEKGWWINWWIVHSKMTKVGDK